MHTFEKGSARDIALRWPVLLLGLYARYAWQIYSFFRSFATNISQSTYHFIKHIFFLLSLPPFPCLFSFLVL